MNKDELTLKALDSLNKKLSENRSNSLSIDKAMIEKRIKELIDKAMIVGRSKEEYEAMIEEVIEEASREETSACEAAEEEVVTEAVEECVDEGIAEAEEAFDAEEEFAEMSDATQEDD